MRARPFSAIVTKNGDTLESDGESGTRAFTYRGETMALPEWMQTVMTLVGGGVGVKAIELSIARLNKKEDLSAQIRKELRDENITLKAEVDKLEGQLLAKRTEMDTFVKRTEKAIAGAEAVSAENAVLRERNAELLQQNSALIAQNRSLITQNGQLSAEAAALASDLRALQQWFATMKAKNRETG